MNKKHYYVLAPASSSKERLDELKAKASMYYGEKEYEYIFDCEDSKAFYLYTVGKFVNQKVLTANAGLLSIALHTLMMSQVDSVYISKDYDSNETSNLCAMLALTYGVDVVYESF